MAIAGAVSQTAVEAWDKRWATSEGRADWLEPHPAVVAILPELHALGARRVLDLGCGVGRHALLLTEHGFDVEAIDGSLAGLTVVRETAATRGLPVSLHQGLADALPFPDAGFDFVLSWNVIHHAGRPRPPAGRDLARVAACRAAAGDGAVDPRCELRHWPCDRSRHFRHRPGRAKRHPHCYCDPATLSVGLPPSERTNIRGALIDSV
jgi:SAM-dependent methyltransferase